MIKDSIRKFTDTIKNNPSFTVREQVGYAAGIFGNCMAQDSVNTYYDNFFRFHMKIKDEHMTLMSNILIPLGFIISPIAGNILDTPVSPDRRPPSKTILKLTPIPFAVTSMLLFLSPFGSNGFLNFIYAMIVKFIYNSVDAFYDTSLNTMSLRMTNNSKDRKNFYTVSTLASALGSMLPGWVMPLILKQCETDNQEKWGYFFVALFFCIIGLITMFRPYFTLNEKIRVTERPQKQKINWDGKTVSTLLHSRSFVVLQIANFFEQIRQLSYTLLPYMYRDVLDDYGMKAAIDAISGALSYVGLASVPFVTSRFSARTVTSAGFGYTGFFYTIMAIMGLSLKKDGLRKYKWIFGVLIGLAGMPNNAISASKKVLVGDATDYMEWYSERTYGTPIHSEGLVTAFQSLLGNAYNLIRTNMYNIAFSKVNYARSDDKTDKVVQSDETLKGIFLMFVLFGIVGNFLACATYLFDNYTGKRKDDITEELQEIRKLRAEGQLSAEGATSHFVGRQ